jgi:hypothetical protein
MDDGVSRRFKNLIYLPTQHIPNLPPSILGASFRNNQFPLLLIDPLKRLDQLIQSWEMLLNFNRFFCTDALNTHQHLQENIPDIERSRF